MKNLNLKNLVCTILGVILVGIGVGMLNLSNFGADPFSCMNYGISAVINMSFGTWQLILNVILFIPMVIMGRKYIGLGTLCNMVGVGYVAQFTKYLFSLMPFIDCNSMIVRIVLLLIIGVIITCFGVGLYTKANLGISPYDALAYIIEELLKGKIQFKWLRVITDIFCVAIGFITGSVIGVGTIVMMFFTGPLVQFFKDILSPIFDNDTSKTTLS